MIGVSLRYDLESVSRRAATEITSVSRCDFDKNNIFNILYSFLYECNVYN